MNRRVGYSDTIPATQDQACPMKQKRSDQLREAIEEKIAIGAFPPGKRLDEVELLARFGVSRTPLREALIEVMGELEAMCGRLAARRITADEQKRLNAAHKACRTAAVSRSPDAYYYANEAFHFAIYSASHNTYLAEQARQLHRKLRVYRRLQLRVRDRVAHSFAEHDGIVAAITSADGDLAAGRLRQHVLIQGERFGDLISSLAALAA
jgi:DNA-binding GntR family transcriptional regulator